MGLPRHEDDEPADDSLWQELEGDWRRYEGELAAQAAVRIGFIGIFLFGFVLGPWALAKVWRAEALGVTTNFGEVMGWVATYVGLLHLAFGVMYLSL